MIAAETFLDLARDPNHWGMEILVEVVTGLLLTPIIRRAVRWHDRKEHNK